MVSAAPAHVDNSSKTDSNVTNGSEPKSNPSSYWNTWHGRGESTYRNFGYIDYKATSAALTKEAKLRIFVFESNLFRVLKNCIFSFMSG